MESVKVGVVLNDAGDVAALCQCAGARFVVMVGGCHCCWCPCPCCRYHGHVTHPMLPTRTTMNPTAANAHKPNEGTVNEQAAQTTMTISWERLTGPKENVSSAKQIEKTYLSGWMWKMVEVRDLETNIKSRNSTLPNGSCDHYFCDVERYVMEIWTILSRFQSRHRESQQRHHMTLWTRRV